MLLVLVLDAIIAFFAGGAACLPSSRKVSYMNGPYDFLFVGSLLSFWVISFAKS
jgi:hypothetical protein